MVDVWGMTASSASPNTLCRPTGRRVGVAANMPSSTARTRRRQAAAGLHGPGQEERARAIVQQRRVGRAQRVATIALDSCPAEPIV